MASTNDIASCQATILQETGTGPYNIPKIKFIDVETITSTFSIDLVVRCLQELHNKYQYMELSLLNQKKVLLGKQIDIRDALEAISVLKQKKENEETIENFFVLSDSIHCRASVKPTKTVYLWLGANVLMEYPLNEAQDFLTKNKENAQVIIDNISQSLRFLRCQLTTTEVNIARVHNYGVSIKNQKPLDTAS